MRFTVTPSALADAAGWAAQALPKRPAVPVLAGMRLEAGDGTLTVSAFDYDTAASATINADVGETGVAVVPGRMFTEITRSLPVKDASVATTGSQVTITCGPATFTLMALPAGEYPVLPEMPPAVGTLGSETFAAVAAQVAVAAGRDDTLPVLTGVCLVPGKETLTLAGTDRYRLAVRDVAWDAALRDDLAPVIFPAQSLRSAAKAMTGGQTVTLSLGDGMAGLAGKDRTLVVRLLGGDFPSYRKLLRATSPFTARVDSGTLAEVVKRAALVAERNTAVHLHFTAGSLRITAGTGEEATAEEITDAGWDGEAFTIAFSPQYLLDGLDAVGEGTIRFGLLEPGKPAVLTADVDEPEYTYLLMPIRPGS